MNITRRIVQSIDSISEWSGKIFCLLIIPLIAGTVYDVFMRYALQSPTKWAYEMTWMEYGAMFMLGGAYTLLHNGHIRVDIFWRNLSDRAKAIFDSLMYLVMFFPLFYILIVYAAQFAHHSWLIRETSYLSYWQPPVYPVKIVMAVGLILFALQALSETLRNLAFAIKGERI
ncbi:MAG: TRAP transporter small permease subunit [Dehalococcoidia bacterium]|nr:TRAP transporter small permease subunit [Dehalococcoidia bacterium]